MAASNVGFHAVRSAAGTAPGSCPPHPPDPPAATSRSARKAAWPILDSEFRRFVIWFRQLTDPAGNEGILILDRYCRIGTGSYRWDPSRLRRTASRARIRWVHASVAAGGLAVRAAAGARGKRAAGPP